MSQTFRTPLGKWLTQALFYETNLSGDRHQCRYTLKDHDHKGLPSLYRLYIEANDLTEFEFAKTYFENYPHWEHLCSANWFKPYIERWRKELELKIRAQALKEVQKVAASKDHKAAYEANKFLLNGAWKTEKKPSRGRPSKSEITKEAQIIAEEVNRLEEDAKLISLSQDGVGTLQ